MMVGRQPTKTGTRRSREANTPKLRIAACMAVFLMWQEYF